MKTINHQLKETDFYIPNWDVEHLFVGTFNPEGGEKVNYYYGRPKNQTWKLISKIFSDKFDPNSKDFFELLKKHKIGCIDMIDKVIASDEKIDKIIGKGYSDSKIINKSVKRVYNTDEIVKKIHSNQGLKIYSTWGKGSNLKEWKNETEKLDEIIPLVSPSMAAKVPKGAKKFEYMLSDWESKIH
mgnify:FL=1